MPDSAESPATNSSVTDGRTGRAESAPTRRIVLQAAGLVTLASGTGAALAGCSSDPASTPASSTAPSSDSSSASSQPSSASPSPAKPSAASSPATSAKAGTKKTTPSGPSVAKADVPNGGGVILPNADYVVTQPVKGTYKAFSKICTHQQCPVAMVINREIVCNCHNSHFSITDGSVVSGPANKPLPAAKTTVSADRIVISG